MLVVCYVNIDQGWGLLNQFPPSHYFPHFSALPKHTLAIEYHVYIWRVLPQLSCGDTCQIWIWFKESNISKIKILFVEVLIKWALVTPTPVIYYGENADSLWTQMA